MNENTNGKMNMKRQDITTIVTAALGTATLTVATFLAGSTEAGNEAPTAVIAKPKFKAQGVEITMAPAGGRVFKAGDKPVFEITAVNTTDKPATLSTGVKMTASAPRDAVSRVAVAPEPLLAQVRQIELQPRETRVVKLSTDKSLPANSSIAVSFSEATRSQSITPKVAPSPSSTGTASTQPQARSSSRPGVTVVSFSTAVPAKPARAAK